MNESQQNTKTMCIVCKKYKKVYGKSKMCLYCLIMSED